MVWDIFCEILGFIAAGSKRSNQTRVASEWIVESGWKNRHRLFTPKQSENLSFFSSWQVDLSRGSYGHPNICCRPCILFIFNKCHKPDSCGFCHMPHETWFSQVCLNMRDTAELPLEIVEHGGKWSIIEFWGSKSWDNQRWVRNRSLRASISNNATTWKCSQRSRSWRCSSHLLLNVWRQVATVYTCLHSLHSQCVIDVAQIKSTSNQWIPMYLHCIRYVNDMQMTCV